MSTRTWISVIAACGFLAPLNGIEATGQRLPDRGEGVVVEWPSRTAPRTLQQAIDVVPDGGTLRIKAGVFDIREPLFIRNKLIKIRGAGCADVLPRGGRGPGVTHLAGVRPQRVVPFREGAALATVVGASSVSVTDIQLSGFDAGIRVMDADAAGSTSPTLTLQNTCISDVVRGIESSSSASKIVLENVSIKNVLWNGISISPAVLGAGLQSFLTTFGLTILNTGQACVVVKNALYSAFQDHHVNCGFNGGPPGLGGGVMAVNSGVNFVQSTVNASNGPGLAANGGTTLIQHGSQVFLALGFGIQLTNPLFAQIKDSEVRLTHPFPPGHFQAGHFGDGVVAVGQGTVWMGNMIVRDNVRTGLGNWGSFVDLGQTQLLCNGAFNLEGEAFPTSADAFLFHDRGGVTCGCTASTVCGSADTAGVTAPLPPGVIE
jgi:hypothetical protein